MDKLIDFNCKLSNKIDNYGSWYGETLVYVPVCTYINNN